MRIGVLDPIAGYGSFGSVVLTVTQSRGVYWLEDIVVAVKQYEGRYRVCGSI